MPPVFMSRWASVGYALFYAPYGRGTGLGLTPVCGHRAVAKAETRHGRSASRCDILAQDWATPLQRARPSVNSAMQSHKPPRFLTSPSARPLIGVLVTPCSIFCYELPLHQ